MRSTGKPVGGSIEAYSDFKFFCSQYGNYLFLGFIIFAVGTVCFDIDISIRRVESSSTGLRWQAPRSVQAAGLLDPFARIPTNITWDSCIRIMHRQNCTDWRRESDDIIPCQAEIIYDMIVAIDEVLKKNNVQFWYAFGTLLGAARSSTIIPWTGDADLMFTSPPFKQFLPFIQDELYRKGILVFPEHESRYVAGRACISPESAKYARWKLARSNEQLRYDDRFPYLDFFNATVNKTGMVNVDVFHCAFKAETVFPVGTIRLYDRDITAPRDVEKYLVQNYGPKWQKPPPRHKRHGSQECRKEWLDLV